jgi:hypothetical protein
MAQIKASAQKKTEKMTMEEFWKLAEREIWPKSSRRSCTRLFCNKCSYDAKGYRDSQNRSDHSGHAPLLPIDFPTICPDYGGKCPRCGGDLRDSFSG